MSLTFPPAFEQRMKSQLGDDFEKFRHAHESESPTSIRINPAKTALPEINRVPWTAFGQYLEKRPVFTLDPLLHAGGYYVQEASSMFLEQIIRQSADLTKPLKVLDLCAAPGGKSTHLLSLINSDSLLVSNEVIRARTTILSENIQKWGNPNVVVTSNDPRDFQRLQGYFDIIVIDAPCSGEGLFRKDPEAMKEWSTDNATLCSQRQTRILEDVWPALKQDGILVYCTCTYNEKENEQTVAWLSETNAAVPVDIAIDPAWSIEKITTTHTIGYHFYPHRTKGEGFFITALRKTQEEDTARIRAKQIFHNLPAKTSERLHDWLTDPLKFDFILQEELILMIPAQFRMDIEFISKELKLITKGTAVAGQKHDKLIPEHAFALSSSMRKENFMQADIDLDTALAYLRKDNVVLNDDRKGFALMMYKGLALGWVNLLGNRVNSLYPSAWRVRMS